MNKKHLTPQVIFPIVIVCTLIIVLTISAFRPPQSFTAIKMDTPGYTSASWINIDEETFYEQLSVAIVIENVSSPTYYTLQEPWDESSIPIDCYEFYITDILAAPLTVEEIEAGTTGKVSAMSNALNLLSSESGDLYLLFLRDRRDAPDFTPREGYSIVYYNDYFDAFGYDIITPIVSIIPVKGNGTIKTSFLPPYLQGEGEYTTYEELREILYQERIERGLIKTP